jgi:hypothetical protein
MFAAHDHDRMTITEAIALTHGAGLGFAMVLDGPAFWLTPPMAPVVLVYALALVLVVTARTAVVRLRRRQPSRLVPSIRACPSQLEASVIA